MPVTNNAEWQWNYCRLFTALTDDRAVRQSIITRQQEMPLMHFFYLVRYNDRIARWLTSNDGQIIESHLVMLFGWLHDQLMLNCRFKSQLARYLYEEGSFCSVRTYQSMKRALSDHVPNWLHINLSETLEIVSSKVPKNTPK